MSMWTLDILVRRTNLQPTISVMPDNKINYYNLYKNKFTKSYLPVSWEIYGYTNLLSNYITSYCKVYFLLLLTMCKL